MSDSDATLTRLDRLEARQLAMIELMEDIAVELEAGRDAGECAFMFAAALQRIREATQ